MKSNIQMVTELLPASREWMIGKGYVVVVFEDGVETFKLTAAGEAYFASITKGGENAVGNNPESRSKKAK